MADCRATGRSERDRDAHFRCGAGTRHDRAARVSAAARQADPTRFAAPTRCWPHRHGGGCSIGGVAMAPPADLAAELGRERTIRKLCRSLTLTWDRLQ